MQNFRCCEMKAYKLVNDYDTYQTLRLDTLQLVKQLDREDMLHQLRRMSSTNNTPLIDHWGEVECIFKPIADTRAIEIPDISVWKGTSLVFSGRAHAYFKLMLEPFGEFLPIIVEGYDFYIFRITCEGKVDFDNSAREDDAFGEPMTVTSLSFESEDIQEKLLFKSKYEFYLYPFCNQAFKDLCDEYRLEGLIFREDLASTPWRE